jgi:hypothetical protein
MPPPPPHTTTIVRTHIYHHRHRRRHRRHRCRRPPLLLPPTPSHARIHGRTHTHARRHAVQVLGSVDAAGQRSNTIVFFSSDNGPWTNHHLLGGSAGPFRDGKGSVWEGGVREPGLVSWPGVILPRIESEPVATWVTRTHSLFLARKALEICMEGKTIFWTKRGS